MEAMEMEHPVDEEAEYLVGQRPRPPCHLLWTEDDVAKEVSMKPVFFSLSHGEGQDIGRALYTPELPVQTGHLVLFHKEEA
jgi:hypothetical protein